MKSNVIIVIIFFSFLFNCEENKEPESELSYAQQVVDMAYKAAGADKVEYATISFDFRERSYEAVRKNGRFSLVRIFRDSLDQVKDELNNDGFVRYVNGEITEVPDSMAIRYSNSVNSVHYFSVLPYGLKDEAVNLKYLDSVEIKGNTYHKIQVSFDQEGGGVDYEDIFIYWINTKTNHIDYMGYTYYTDDGGMRFREAYNPRVIEGIRFADYRNYKPKDSTLIFSEIDRAFENDELELLSTINLENISVN